MFVNLLAEQLAGKEEGTTGVEEGNEDVLVRTYYEARDVGLGEQSRLQGIGELFTLRVRHLEAEYPIDGLRVVRELEQQEAAVYYQQTVLKAWQEIDDSLTAYAARQQRTAALTARLGSTGQAYGPL